MIVRAQDLSEGCPGNSFVLLMSRQDICTLRDIFKSWLCVHDGNKIGDTESAVGILAVLENSDPRFHRFVIDDNDVSGDPVYVISLKETGSTLAEKYNYYGMVYRDEMGEFLGISVEEGRDLYDFIIKKD